MNKKIGLYILSTFHFNGSDVDLSDLGKINTVDKDMEIQLQELVHRIKKTNVNKIFVEALSTNQTIIDEEYLSYRNGEFSLSNNEVHQLGFRLALSLEHPRVYCADAEGDWNYEDVVAYAIANNQDRIIHNIFKEGIDSDLDKLNNPILSYLSPADAPHKKIISTHTLVDKLIGLNSIDTNIWNMDQYMLALAQIGAKNQYIGADLIGDYYKRNIRIYSNILRSLDAQLDENILLIIGFGHTAFMKSILQYNSLFNILDILPFLKS